MSIFATLYTLAVLLVIAGHIFFAYGQWFRWPQLCKKLTTLDDAEISKTAFLGRSIASYNASIAVGLLLSFLLPAGPMGQVQGVVLALIVLTSSVGAAGTKGSTILKFRLLPAAAALILLLLR